MSERVLLAFVFAFGAVVGSFLNVVIHRLPRGESIVFPGSRCPHCKEAIPAWANVPILAWLVLRGRCRHCRAPISMRYPVVEALTGVLFLALWLQHPASLRLIAEWSLAAALVAIAFIDWDFKIVPNSITYPGIPLAVASSFLVPPSDWPGPFPYWASAVAGCLIGGGLTYAISAFYEWRRREVGLGMGDVKLIALMGGFFGVEAVFGILLVGSLLGILHWVALHLLGRASRSTRVAFAPSLAAAGVLHLFAPDLVPSVLSG